jgi:biopolymer transport protein ExbB/TolQ
MLCVLSFSVCLFVVLLSLICVQWYLIVIVFFSLLLLKYRDRIRQRWTIQIWIKHVYENCDKKNKHHFQKRIFMSSIEQLETLRNAELYDDCKTLVIYEEIFLFIKFPQ